ncbi:MAG: ComEC/Rec2 family competence protein [Candidatus Uhrbacteria bacterium]
MELASITNSPSRSLFVVLLGFLLGIFVGGVVDQMLPSWWMIVGMFVCLVGVIILRGIDTCKGVNSMTGLPRTRRFASVQGGRLSVPQIRLFLLVIFAFLLGLWRFSQLFFPADAFLVSDTLNREIRIEGVVSDEVVEKAQSQQVTIDQVRVGDQTALGKVMVWMPKYPTISFGDQLAFRCELEVPEPFEGFAYDRYLRTRGVLAVCWWPESADIKSDTLTGVGPFRADLLSFKHSIYDKTEQIFSEPHSTFLSGLLFGGKGSVSSDLRQDFVDTGTSHILAASGYNVGIFSRFLFLALVGLFFRRRTALVMVAGAIGLYVVIAGFDPAVTRAGIMGLIIVFGRSLGRARNDAALRNILTLTVAVMLLINPRLLLDDVGFQLSFLATIGLVMIVPRIEHKFRFIPTTGGFREALVSTLAATIITLPILILQFGQLSIVSLLVNFLVLPIVPYAMGFGAVAIAIGFISIKLASIISIAAWTCLSTMLYLIRWFGALPIASVLIPYHQIIAAVVTILLIGFLVWLYRRTQLRHEHFGGERRWGLAIISFSILFVACFGFQTFDSRGSTVGIDTRQGIDDVLAGVIPTRPLRVWFFDVGQGDAIFIQTQDNKQILIDGGPGEAVLSKLGAVMPFWDRSIDMIISTHPHSDHISGLIEVLDRYKVDQVVMTGVNYRSSYLDAFEDRVEAEGAEVIVIDDVIDLWIGKDARKGVNSIDSLTAVFPIESYRDQYIDEVNETSIVIELTYEETSILLTGDMYVEQEAEVLRNISTEIDVLKVPHQGSISSTSTQFLEALDLETAIITVGADNSYGHPHPVVLQRLYDQGIEILRTDLDGDILLLSVGQEPSVRSSPLIF